MSYANYNYSTNQPQNGYQEDASRYNQGYQQDNQQYNQGYNQQEYNQQYNQQNINSNIQQYNQQNAQQHYQPESQHYPQQPAENPYYKGGDHVTDDEYYRPDMQQHIQKTQQQTVIIDQRGQGQGVPPHKIKATGEWSSGLCGCFEDCCSCLHAFCCYHCYMSTLTVQMDEWYCAIFCLKQIEPFIPIARMFTAVTGCFKDILCATVTIGNIFLVPMRTRLRTEYGIEGSILKDICAMCWCQICAALQMTREMKHRGGGLGLRNL